MVLDCPGPHGKEGNFPFLPNFLEVCVFRLLVSSMLEAKSF